MKINGKITISRPSGSGCDYIAIGIYDDDANIRFCEARIKYAYFAQLVTGLAHVDCDLEVIGLQNVGKKREWKKLEFPFDGAPFYAKDEARKEMVKHVPEGWTASGHFGSQNSFFQREGIGWARTTIERWVDKDSSSAGRNQAVDPEREEVDNPEH